MRFFGTLGALLVAVIPAGCYSLRPAVSALPNPGERVALDVTDAGRVTLGGTMGPEISRIDGLLIDSETDSFLLSVQSVRFLRGGYQSWSGERVRINREHVGTMYRRQLSRTRTAAFTAIAVGGFAVLVSRGVFGNMFGNEGKDDEKPIPIELVWP